MLACLIAIRHKEHRERLKESLAGFEEEVQVVGEAATLQEVYQQIKRLRPEVIFLETNLLDSPFAQELEELATHPIKLVLVSAFHEKIPTSFQENTFGHVFLPAHPQHIETLLDGLFSTPPKTTLLSTSQPVLRRIGITDNEGINIIDLDKIIRCEADGNYTKIFLSDGTRLVSAKTLKEYDSYLSNHHFFRIHQSHLINLRFIKRYTRGNGGTVVMWDGSQLEVARRRKPLLVEKLTGLF